MSEELTGEARAFVDRLEAHLRKEFAGRLNAETVQGEMANKVYQFMVGDEFGRDVLKEIAKDRVQNIFEKS